MIDLCITRKNGSPFANSTGLAPWSLLRGMEEEGAQPSSRLHYRDRDELRQPGSQVTRGADRQGAQGDVYQGDLEQVKIGQNRG